MLIESVCPEELGYDVNAKISAPTLSESVILDMERQNSATDKEHWGHLSPQEWETYRLVIQRAKAALNVRHLGLIAPIRTLPGDSNTGIGSLLGAKAFFRFLTCLGFDTVQVDPEGKTKLADPSPYTGTVFSANPLYIDLKDLVENPEWCGLLGADRLMEVEAGNPEPDGDRVAYQYIFTAQEKVLQEVYAAYQAKCRMLGDLPEREARCLKDLQTRFEAFIQANQSWLEPDSLYEALSVAYGNDYWPNWHGPRAELDKNLYNAQNDEQREAAKARIAELKEQFADIIGAYAFSQFILSRQKQAFKAFSKEEGFAVMADRQVGFSDRDVWAYQRLFLPGWSMGCPPDYFSDNGQAWGFPVLDPKQLFNEDGSLGEGGLLLLRLFEKIFEENPGGVRIDHIIGLIDPWVYPAGMAHTKDGGRLYSSPHREDLAPYALVGTDAINPGSKPDEEHWLKDEAMTEAVVDRYARVVEKIVLAAARNKGISLENVICEDLGTLTTPVQHVLKRLNLSGIRVTQFSDPGNPNDIFHGNNVAAHYWITPGSHDNEPLLRWAKKLVKAGKEEGSDAVRQHAHWLTEELIKDPAQKDAFREKLSNDALALLEAKLAELFASPAGQVQLFFADLFGLEEVYNRPGTSGASNWRLRIPKDFVAAYFKGLRKGRALNLPAVMKLALEARDNADPQLMADLQQMAERLRSA